MLWNGLSGGLGVWGSGGLDLRVSTPDHEYIRFYLGGVVQLPARRPEQGLILWLQVQILELRTQNPDLPLDRLVVLACDR